MFEDHSPNSGAFGDVRPDSDDPHDGPAPKLLGNLDHCSKLSWNDLIKRVGIAATLAVGLQSYTVQDIYANCLMIRMEPPFAKSIGNFAKNSGFSHFDTCCLCILPNPVGSG